MNRDEKRVATALEEFKTWLAGLSDEEFLIVREIVKGYYLES